VSGQRLAQRSGGVDVDVVERLCAESDLGMLGAHAGDGGVPFGIARRERLQDDLLLDLEVACAGASPERDETSRRDRDVGLGRAAQA